MVVCLCVSGSVSTKKREVPLNIICIWVHCCFSLFSSPHWKAGGLHGLRMRCDIFCPFLTPNWSLPVLTPPVLCCLLSLFHQKLIHLQLPALWFGLFECWEWQLDFLWSTFSTVQRTIHKMVVNKTHVNPERKLHKFAKIEIIYSVFNLCKTSIDETIEY